MRSVHLQLVSLIFAVVLVGVSGSVFANLRIHDVLTSGAIDTPVNSQGEPLAIDLQLSAMGRDIRLQLQPSRLNKVAKLNGIADASLSYLYEGTVAGDANSWARISILDGVPSGYLFHYGKLLQLESRSQLGELIETTEDDQSLILVEPASSVNAARLFSSFNWQVDYESFAPAYKLSTIPAFDPNRVDQSLAANQSPVLVNSDNTKLSYNLTGRNAIGISVTRAMRIGIVVDSRFNEAHQNRGLARALSIINSVDAIYQSQLGLAVIVEGIRVYDDPATDPMRNNSGSVDQILGNFRPIRQADERLPDDLTLVHLFSGHRDPNRVIGLGWISTACRLDGYDLSLSTPFPFDALLAAHEIAHNLGALHDDNPRCLAETVEQPNTLMWPALSGSSTAEFSQCSTRNMQASKNASCNQDNIDVSVRLRTFPSSEFLRRSVVVEVFNKDVLQRPTELVTNTIFPLGTLIEDLSNGCEQVSTTMVRCDHGTVRAGASHSMSMTATLLNRSRENVQTQMQVLNATDIFDADNRAVIQLLTFDETTGEAVEAASPQFADELDLQTDDTVRGIGSISALSVAILFLLVGVVGIRRWLRQPRHQTSRFTA